MMAARSARCVAAVALLAAAGCGAPEAVRVLDESKSSSRVAPAPLAADQKSYRTLAAMVPVAGPVKENAPHWWFFKVSGPADVVARYEADFEKLVASFRANEQTKYQLAWDLPPGWTEAAGGPMRLATFKSPQPPILYLSPTGGLRVGRLRAETEVAVSQAGGFVLSNAQRWWGQLWGKDKERELTAVLMTNYVRQQAVNGRLVLRVDMYGPNDPNEPIRRAATAILTGSLFAAAADADPHGMDPHGP